MSRDRSPSEPEQPEEELTVVEDWTRPDFETPESMQEKLQKKYDAQQARSEHSDDEQTGERSAPGHTTSNPPPEGTPSPFVSPPSKPPPLPSQRSQASGTESQSQAIPKPPPLPDRSGSRRPPATSSTTQGLGGTGYVPPTPGQPPARYGRSVSPPSKPSSPPPLKTPPSPSGPPSRPGRPLKPAWSEESTQRVTPQAKLPATPPRPSAMPPRPATGSIPSPTTGARPSPSRAPAAGSSVRPSAAPRASIPPPADPAQRIAWAVAQLQGVKDRLTKREADINSLRSRLGLLDARVGELEEEHADRHTAPDGAASTVASLDERIASLEKVAEKVRAGDSALRGILDEQRKAVEGRQSDVAALERKIEALTETLEGFGTIQGEMREQQERLEEALAARDREIAELRAALGKTSADAPSAKPPAGKSAAKASTGAKAAEPEKKAASKRAKPDDLKAIKGIGPKFEKALVKIGVTTYDEIASWSDDDLDRIASEIGTRPQRMRGWVEHARELAASR